MKSDLIAWLAYAGSWAWHSALTLFIVVNAGAGVAVLVNRSQSMVDRWTPRWLAANLVLLGFGLGTPLVTWALRLGLSLLPEFGSSAVLPAK
ncbi:MAG: hypothetical protein SF070_05175 [Gemmatimonadota bacterium]|nr:hypothetical protein [Gemmatimonadota bacterium]